MALKNILMGAASSFAHFRGIASTAASEDEGEDMRHAEDEGCEEDEQEGASAGEGDGKRGKNKSKKGAKDKGDDDADGDDDEEEDEGEDDEEEGGDKDKAKAASFKRGRKAERKRCAKIFESPAAAQNTQLACRLAFTTGLSATAALAVLEAAPAPRGALSQRMEASGDKSLTPGASSELKGAASITASWDRAMSSFAPKPK